MIKNIDIAIGDLHLAKNCIKGGNVGCNYKTAYNLFQSAQSEIETCKGQVINILGE